MTDTLSVELEPLPFDAPVDDPYWDDLIEACCNP
jgi:hypothetical protein